MKKLLILTCNTGMGHNSSAAAVKEEAAEAGWQCDTYDALGFLSEKASEFIAAWHVRLYRYAPAIFDKGYSLAESIADLGEEGTVLSRALSHGTKKLLELMEKEGYDAALATHNFAAIMLTEALRSRKESIPSGFLVTDYTCAPTTKGCGLDHIFIPHRDLTGNFTDIGIDPGHIIVSGIPVKKAFRQKADKAFARQTLGIETDCRHILMMCGSMGCGPIEDICTMLSQKAVPGTRITVVCGSNEKLLHTLSRKNLPFVEPVGYRNDIPLLMDSADLFITKPGGISITEAAAKRLPMVLVDAVGGCEDYNLDFFVSRGCAVTADSPAALAALSIDILKDESTLSSMKSALEREIPIDGATTIFETLCCESDR